MIFPDTGATASIQNITVNTGDAGAAAFDIGGEASTAIQASIVETDLDMVVGGTTITVDTFTFGGSLAADGTATLDGTGNLTGANVGATAAVPANPDVGAYSGSLTFRVLYQ